MMNKTTDYANNLSNKEHYYKSDHSVMEHLTQQWKIVFSVLFGILSISATFANGIVIKTIHRYTILHTKSNKILAALAVTDLLASVLVAPINVAQLLNRNSDATGKIYITRTCLSTVLILAADNITAFISFDRCLHIVKLSNYEIQNKTLCIVITVCWLIPVLTSLLLPLRKDRLFVYLVNVEVWIILLIITVCYATLLIALQQYTTRDENILNDAYVKDQEQATRTVVIIITLYILMRLPLVISFFLVMTNRHNLSFNTKFYAFANFLCVSNSGVNPLIYCYRTSSLWKHVKKLFQLESSHVSSQIVTHSENFSLNSLSKAV